MLIGIVFIISVGSFYLIHLLPGNITTVIEGPGASPSNQAKLFKLLGLNKPIYEQYFTWTAISGSRSSPRRRSPVPFGPPFRSTSR